MDDRQLFTALASPSGPNWWRVWLAFLLMPPVSAGAAAVVFPVLSLGGATNGGSGVFAFIAAIASVFVTVAGALPMFLSLKRRGPISFSRTLWAGAALGNAPGALYAILILLFTLVHIAAGTISQHLSTPASLLAGALRVAMLGTAVGTISAAVFWVIALRGTDLAD